MKIINKREPLFLWLGDILVFTPSLWLALALRFQTIPSNKAFLEHFWPFSILFLIWFLVFFIAGLYEKHTLVFKKNLALKVFNTQVFNSFLAIVFFYFIPYFGITPKIILFIYILISLSLISLWRIYGQNIFTWQIKEKAIFFSDSAESEQLLLEIKNNPRYGIDIAGSFKTSDLEQKIFQVEISNLIKNENISLVILDLENQTLKNNFSNFYNLLFSEIRFVNINLLYEDIFDRIPLSLISYDWFLKNISLSTSIIYDSLKRLTDILTSLLLGLLSSPLYPFICLGIKIEDHGKSFIIQERVGRNNKLVKIFKFRTMIFNDSESSENKATNKITNFGAFLRKSRLDEIPQLWNVLKGDLSLIGPRPELPSLVNVYEKEIPYYKARHLIKTGLSGWAQLYHKIHPHQGANIEETKNKLSYDLYYIKNRSLFLDIKIFLKTIKTLMSRTGR